MAMHSWAGLVLAGCTQQHVVYRHPCAGSSLFHVTPFLQQGASKGLGILQSQPPVLQAHENAVGPVDADSRLSEPCRVAMHLFHPALMPIGMPPHLQATADHEAYALLQREREPDLHKLARALLEHETLDAEDIKAVLSGTFTRVPVGGQEAAGDGGGVVVNTWLHLGPACKKSTGLLIHGCKLDDRSGTVHCCHGMLR